MKKGGGRRKKHTEGFSYFTGRGSPILFLLHMFACLTFFHICWRPVRGSGATRGISGRKSEVIFNEESENNYKIINSQKLKDLLGYEFIHKDLMNY